MPRLRKRTYCPIKLAMSVRARISRMTSVVDSHAENFAFRAKDTASQSYPQDDAELKRIFDPVHHFIELIASRSRVCSTCPSMQRLRRLRQLGLAYLAFPSAEHSRFTHALGALAMGDARLRSAARGTRRTTSSDEADFDAAAALAARGSAAARRRTRAVQPCVRSGARRRARSAHAERSSRCPTSRNARRRARGRRRRRARPDRRRTRTALSRAARAGQRTEPRRRPHGLPAARRLLHRRRERTLRRRSAARVAAPRSRRDGSPRSGIDGRGVVALESFVMARYMMFASVYFHHTTRMFERILHEVLRELWPDPRRARPDRRVSATGTTFACSTRCARSTGEAARALRERITHLRARRRVQRRARSARLRSLRSALRGALRRGRLGRLAGATAAPPAPSAATRRPRRSGCARAGGIVDAREASDLIAKLREGYWRKLFVKKSAVRLDEARALCQEIITAIAL